MRSPGPYRVTVQVFARYPRSGEVKSRLAADIGDEAACALHVSLTEAWLAQLSTLPTRFQIELWGTESASGEHYQRWLAQFPRLRFRRQAEGDLGEKLHKALVRGLQHTAKVIQTGTDCPVLNASHVYDIDRALDMGANSAFLPAEDGGYVLSAYRGLLPGQFENIDWGTDTVLTTSLEQTQTPYFVGPELWDIDYLSDFQRWQTLQNTAS